jgi:hypothetical protein
MTDQEILSAWIDALETGKYPPCRGRFVNAEGEHCAVGVLACILNIPLSRHKYQDASTLVALDATIDRVTNGKYKNWISISAINDTGGRDKSHERVARALKELEIV